MLAFKQIIHDFLFLALAAILFIEAKPYLAILVEGHLSIISMKLKWNRPRGIGGFDV